ASQGGSISCAALPSPNRVFLEQPVLQRQLGHHFLQRAGLPPQLLDLVRRRCPRRVTGQALLASLQKFLRPAVIEVLHNPLAPAQLGDAVLAAQAGQHDPDLFFRRKLLPGGTACLLDNLLGRLLHRPGFLSHLRSFNGYDGPEILPSSTSPFCLIGADAGHLEYPYVCEYELNAINRKRTRWRLPTALCVGSSRTRQPAATHQKANQANC